MKKIRQNLSAGSTVSFKFKSRSLAFSGADTTLTYTTTTTTIPTLSHTCTPTSATCPTGLK